MGNILRKLVIINNSLSLLLRQSRSMAGLLEKIISEDSSPTLRLLDILV